MRKNTKNILLGIVAAIIAVVDTLKKESVRQIP